MDLSNLAVMLNGFAGAYPQAQQQYQMRQQQMEAQKMALAEQQAKMDQMKSARLAQAIALQGLAGGGAPPQQQTPAPGQASVPMTPPPVAGAQGGGQPMSPLQRPDPMARLQQMYAQLQARNPDAPPEALAGALQQQLQWAQGFTSEDRMAMQAQLQSMRMQQQQELAEQRAQMTEERMRMQQSMFNERMARSESRAGSAGDMRLLALKAQLAAKGLTINGDGDIVPAAEDVANAVKNVRGGGSGGSVKMSAAERIMYDNLTNTASAAEQLEQEIQAHPNAVGLLGRSNRLWGNVLNQMGQATTEDQAAAERIRDLAVIVQSGAPRVLSGSTYGAAGKGNPATGLIDPNGGWAVGPDLLRGTVGTLRSELSKRKDVFEKSRGLGASKGAPPAASSDSKKAPSAGGEDFSHWWE